MRYLLPVFALALAGCGPAVEKSAVDQCLRRELFRECMASLPAGPVATQYNDWDDVVDSCNAASLQQSTRLVANVKQECRP